MATLPAQLPPDAAPDAASAPSGYCIEIKVSGDGSISVGVEPESAEAAEPGDEEDSQPVANIREACKLVMQIFASQGQAPDAGADQAAMTAGYGKD